MNVCMVWDSEYPWDIRVDKIARSLLKAGHEVHLVCRNRRREVVHEARDGLSIHRLPLLPNPLNSHLSFPAFFSPLWMRAIARVVRQHQCDLIFVRDIPLALAGVFVGTLTGRPVVLDLAENYPAMLHDFWRENRRRPLNWAVRNPWIARSIEKIAVRRADHLLVVVREAMDRVHALGVDDQRLSIVMNTPLPERLVAADERSLEAEASNRYFDILYLGFLDSARGVDIAVRAMPAVATRIPNARLVIIGTGGQESHLRNLARQVSVADRVLFTGWIPHQRTDPWIASSSVGLVPHEVTESWMTTIPNKLFDYMAFAKPVLVSEARPVRRIVETERCGLVFRNRDVADFTTQLSRMANPSLRRDLGSNGRHAVVDRYNWGTDEKALLSALEGTLKAHAESRARNRNCQR